VNSIGKQRGGHVVKDGYMTHRESVLQSRTSQLIRGRWRQLSVLLATLVLGGCDFSRVEVSCLEHIPSGDTGRFIDQGNGIVLDPQTQLQWYRCAVGQRYTERGCAGSPLLMTWPEIDGYLSEISEKAGEDWRLPNASEFMALGESSCINPALNPNVFPNVVIDNHWVVGEGIKEGEPCGIYTYKGTRSCRLFSENYRPFFMVKAQ
jgi:hypothetical protein